MKFTELKLHDKLLEAISYMGFETATPVQEQVIPIILEDRDLIACAQTGTGKTAAFVLPILDKLIGKKDTHIDTLIIVPTRELAIQIEQQIQGFSYFIGKRCFPQRSRYNNCHTRQVNVSLKNEGC
jgi:superfamily II DNA/RNA helicase